MNKLLLAAIALGLWANAATTFIRPAHADAEYELHRIMVIVSDIENLLRSGTINIHCSSGCKE